MVRLLATGKLAAGGYPREPVVKRLNPEDWTRFFKGAEVNVCEFCNPDVHCQICGEAGQTRVVEVPRPSITLLRYICFHCLRKLGIKW